MNVVICGGRTFTDENVFKECLKYVNFSSDGKVHHRHIEKPVILSGHARGADSLGEVYARTKGYRLVVYPAKWELYGRSAGALRNKEMCDVCDAVIAFWDGRSPGTKHMIKIAKENGKKVLVFDYKGNLREAVDWVYKKEDD